MYIRGCSDIMSAKHWRYRSPLPLVSQKSEIGLPPNIIKPFLLHFFSDNVRPLNDWGQKYRAKVLIVFFSSSSIIIYFYFGFIHSQAMQIIFPYFCLSKLWNKYFLLWANVFDSTLMIILYISLNHSVLPPPLSTRNWADTIEPFSLSSLCAPVWIGPRPLPSHPTPTSPLYEECTSL